MRSVLTLVSTVLNFVALKYLPLTLTSIILFSAPIIVCLLSVTVLGERVGKWRGLAVFSGFIGVLIAFRPFDASFHPAVFLSFLGAISFSFYLLLTRRLAAVVSTDIMQFYVGLVGCVVLIPFAVLNWKPPETSTHFAILIGLDVFAWIGHEFLTRAFRYANVSVLTPYSNSFNVYLSVWRILLFDHYPDQWTRIEAMVIVFSGLMIWIRE